MTDERKSRLMDSLPGRLEYLEGQFALLTGQVEGASDLLKRVIVESSKDIFATEIGSVTPLSADANVNTLTEDIKLTEDIGVLQFIDPNGGARTIRLPRVGVSNKWYIIVNTATP